MTVGLHSGIVPLELLLEGLESAATAYRSGGDSTLQSILRAKNTALHSRGCSLLRG